MSAGQNYPITFQLRADDQATSQMAALMAVMKNGNQVSAETLAKFKDLRADVNLQVRSVNTLRTEWLASNTTLYAFGRAMSSVGAIGTTLIGITNTLLLSQLAMATNAANVAASQQAVRDAQLQYNQAVAQFGPDSKAALDALAALHSAQNNLITTQAQAVVSNRTIDLQYVAIAFSLGSLVAGFINAGASLAAFGQIAGAAAIAGTAFAGAVAALGGSIAFAVGWFGAAAASGRNLAEAFAQWKDMFADLPGPIQFVADVIGALGVSIASLAKQAYAGMLAVSDAISTAEQTILSVFGILWDGITSGAQSAWATLLSSASAAWDGLISGLESAGASFGAAASSAFGWIMNALSAFGDVLSSAWASLWTGLGPVFSTVWNGVTAAIRGGLNFVISLLDAFINAIDAVIGGFNAVAGLVGITLPYIPTIPYLRQGGIAMGPTLAMIGEGGPEAVVPLTGANAGGAGGSTNVYITVQGSVVSERELADIVDRRLWQNYSLRRRMA